MKPYEDVPNSGNMRVLRDVLSLEGVGKKNVILRNNITEEFWQEVIASASDYRVCAVGTPGIGKTTSTCILIRLLLERQQTIVYHVRTDDKVGYVYMFVPPTESTGDVDVHVIPEAQFKCTDSRFNKESIYYVVDPGQTTMSCNPPNIYIGKVIIIASPDNRHWGGSEFEKERDGVSGIFRFYPVWDVHELVAARQLFDRSLSKPAITKRYEEVGGIPRHVFQSNTQFLATLQSQKNAINQLTEEQVQQLTLDDVNSAQTFGTNQPKSVIMVYKCPNRNFEDFTVAVASRTVARLLVEKKMQFLWNVIVNRGGVRGSTSWLSFEIYCQNLMIGTNGLKFIDYKYHNGTNLKARTDEIASSIQLGGCSKITGTNGSLIAAAKKKENILFYSLKPKYVLIDFVYRKDNTIYAFQVTAAATHSCSAKHLKAAIMEAGEQFDFLFHYLTFDARYTKFKLEPVNPFKDDNAIPVQPPRLIDDWTIKVIRIPGPNEDLPVV